MRRKKQIVLLYTLGSLFLILAVYTIENQKINTPIYFAQPVFQSQSERPLEFTDEQLDKLAKLVEGGIEGRIQTTPLDLSLATIQSDGVYILLRSSGRKIGQYWIGRGQLVRSLSTGIDQISAALPPEVRESIDLVEICISSNYLPISADELPNNIERGISGIRFEYESGALAFTPTEMIADNRSFDNAMEFSAEVFGISPDRLRSSGHFETFNCAQILVFLGEQPKAQQIFRGNQIISIDDVSYEKVRQFSVLSSSWLTGQIRENGRMTYRYWPSLEEESQDNNMIRQWMASLAVDRIYSFTKDEPISLLGKKNISYNLENFYSVENELGLIEWNDAVKLGAISLAGLAILEHPDAADFQNELDTLLASTFYLWNSDGSFQNFYRPERLDDIYHNYYPGETLLFWSKLYAQSGDAELLERIMKSFEYYRNWHREKTHPAFIPWQTQAYYEVWKISKNEELKDFIFEMNDWLVGFQQLDGNRYADTLGRFYDPSRTNFGGPHASATGVYLEGLVDAYLLAREVGDLERQAKYANSIRFGIRSLMQLQFADEIDSFYVEKPEFILGGLRSTVYENSIRVDNVQHGLMAILKILALPEARDILP